jgi:hypothetical protein
MSGRPGNLRKIAIDGVVYRWRVQTLDPQHVLLHVVLATDRGNRSPLEVRIRFDDPWLNYGLLITATSQQIQQNFALEPVTPRQVRAIILSAREQGWQPERDHNAWRGFWQSEDEQLVSEEGH